MPTAYACEQAGSLAMAVGMPAMSRRQIAKSLSHVIHEDRAKRRRNQHRSPHRLPHHLPAAVVSDQDNARQHLPLVAVGVPTGDLRSEQDDPGRHVRLHQHRSVSYVCESVKPSATISPDASIT